MSPDPDDDVRPRALRPPEHLPELTRLQEAFLAGIRQADPDAPVPWCGRWRVRSLVTHLARIHHWAAGQARRRQETPLGRGPFDLVELYDRCARELRDTLTELGPDADSWTLTGRGPAAFWHRRQLHETLVHLWDLRTAAALPGAEPARLWHDAVDEVVTVMQPRQVALGRMTAPAAPVLLEAVDTGGRWLLGGPPAAPGGSAVGGGVLGGGLVGGVAPAAEVTGTAEELALVLWRRRSPADTGVVVTGQDPEGFTRLLRERLTP